MANNRRTEKTLPHSLTHTHTRIMTKNAFCGTVDMLPPAYTPLQLLGSPISGWFIMQKLCKDKQNYESRQQPASKNSTATLCHILLHKASHISPTVLLFPKPKRQSLSGYHSPVPISITKPIPESISLSLSLLLFLFRADFEQLTATVFGKRTAVQLAGWYRYRRLVQVNCAAKCKNQLFYKFPTLATPSPSPSSLSAPRERNGHLNSNRKTFAHIEVTLKCALNLISVRRLSRAPNSLSLALTLSPSLSL